MYLKALAGYEKVFGPNHSKSHNLRENLRALDTPIGKTGIRYSESLG
jgi:hypothetical protein